MQQTHETILQFNATLKFTGPAVAGDALARGQVILLTFPRVFRS